jgi:hypothetical protein
MSRFINLSFIFLICLISACKKDNTSPSAFSVKDFQLDGLAQQSSYKNVSLTPQIVVSFSQPVSRSSVASQITLTGATKVTLEVVFSKGDSTLTISCSLPLAALSYYQLFISSNLGSATNLKLSSSLNISWLTQIDLKDKFTRISDDALLDSVQKKTIRYFYDFADPASGMARERNSSATVTTGGSGFGLMAMVAGINRGFIPRPDGIARFTKIITYLEKADRFHGAWPHWSDGSSGKVIPFSTYDDGADLVETSYMAQGLLTVRQYLTPSDTVGNNLINRITNLYNAIEWDWFRQGDQNVLYWHWSPDYAFKINHALSGYFEGQITYVMAASSPTHGIPLIVYANGFAQNGKIVTNRSIDYNNMPYVLPLGDPSPLFWTQYSYLGLNPHFSDNYADYWMQNVNATLIDYNYCIQNPHKYAGYGNAYSLAGETCWGLTASDNPTGYGAQSPDNDNGTISPTAALSAFPYAPTQAMEALHFFYYTLGDRMWGPYGFYDAFNLSSPWTATSTLAIDQGPIVVMIENYRSGLLWNLFESAPEVKAGESVLGFTR